MRESVIFYRSFFEAINSIGSSNDGQQAAEKLAAYENIFNYIFLGQEPVHKEGIGYAIFLMAKPQIDKNTIRYENGVRGGRPLKNEGVEAKEQVQEKPKPNLKRGKTKPNENVNGNEKENGKENGNIIIDESGHQQKRVKHGGDERVKFVGDECVKPVGDEREKKGVDESINLAVFTKEKKEFESDFVDDKFKTVFMRWLNYKKARKELYANADSLMTCYNKLLKESRYDPLIADAMIETAIGNNYQGFFPLRQAPVQAREEVKEWLKY